MVLPVAVFVLLLIFLSSVDITHRALVEPLLVIYAAILIDSIGRLLPRQKIIDTLKLKRSQDQLHEG